jgi:hypothetical protein
LLAGRVRQVLAEGGVGGGAEAVHNALGGERDNRGSADGAEKAAALELLADNGVERFAFGKVLGTLGAAGDCDGVEVVGNALADAFVGDQTHAAAHGALEGLVGFRRGEGDGNSTADENISRDNCLHFL